MWEERFNTPDYVFGTEPALALRDHAHLLVPGQTALSIADGEGRNSVFMAQAGMHVTALELSPSAIAKARALALARGVAVEIRQADVLAEPWEGQFDLVAGIFIQFVGPQERAILFGRIADAVRPGGRVFLHGYRPEQLAYGTGGPPHAENMYTEIILRDHFPDWTVEVCRSHDREIREGRGHSGMSALIDFIARKPG